MRGKTEHVDVIVIGGGAAGLMAAGVAAARGKRVLLLEKNAKLGVKLSITGGKRCNILNAERDVQKLLRNYGASEQFLYSAFSQFGMEDAFSFFEKLGLPLTVQARNRAFPVSERAVDVVNTLRTYIKDGAVQVKLNTPVTRLRQKGGRIECVEAGGKEYSADSYIVATGGMSRPDTGSTGDGFGWLLELGHTVTPPTPTIVPLIVAQSWVQTVAGVSIPDAKITFYADGVASFSKKGPLLFTHTGLSGPTILNSSGRVAELFREGDVTARIDLFPATDLGHLDAQLAQLLSENKNKDLKNACKAFLPPGMADVVLTLIPGLAPDTKVNGVTKEERRKLIELVKGIPLTITGLAGFAKAVVADGGVPLTELDMRTMRSLRVDNLFIVGDLLHIQRPSGGYSLQLCWTTGYVAGTNA